jgi:hypothetical protein
MLLSTVASFGAAWQGNAGQKETTQSAAGQALALSVFTAAAKRLRSIGLVFDRTSEAPPERGRDFERQAQTPSREKDSP